MMKDECKLKVTVDFYIRDYEQYIRFCRYMLDNDGTSRWESARFVKREEL